MVKKAVILAGGLGTRISEETHLKPKPMIEIGGKPILWHIMKIYSSHGINEFIICCGFKGYAIKEYFSNYFLHMSDVTFDMQNNNMIVHHKRTDPWKVSLVDTGDNTMTGGRLLRVKEYLKNENSFCFTYGDGIGDINISALIKFHQNHGKEATLTATRPPGRYGALKFGPKDIVESFKEKPDGDGSWINGGFFVLNYEIFNYIKGDAMMLEREPLTKLVKKKQVQAFKHKDFWQCMDTMRDKNILTKLLKIKKAPWKKLKKN